MQRIDDPDRKAYNTNPKWEVPLEFIEWQPSYTQEVGILYFDVGEVYGASKVSPCACLQDAPCLCQPMSIAELGAQLQLSTDLLQGAEGISGGEWSADWQVRTSSKILHLLKRLTKIGSVPKKAPPPSPQQDSIWQIPVRQPHRPSSCHFSVFITPVALPP